MYVFKEELGKLSLNYLHYPFYPLLFGALCDSIPYHLMFVFFHLETGGQTVLSPFPWLLLQPGHQDCNLATGISVRLPQTVNKLPQKDTILILSNTPGDCIL